MPKYFDIHSHLNFSAYDQDREEVIKRMLDSGTHTIVIGTDYKTSKEAVELAERHEGVYACIGVHPVDDAGATFEKEKFEALVTHPKVVAIGECGLDFFSRSAKATQDKYADRARQEKLFRDQIEFAIKYRKPLMIHARDAYPEVLEILNEYRGGVHGNVHFFAGDWATAERFFDLGFTISFTGVITFASQYDEVVRKAPLSRIMSETDAPFATPAPYREQRNEPAYVVEVVKRIAELRNADFEEVRQALVKNASRMIA